MTTTPFTERDFRDAMGSFTTGVCVLGAKRRDGEAVGMTVNSFTSVSLDPPMVLVCLGSESPRSQAIIDSGRFTISVLAADQEDVSNRFAQPGEGLAPAEGWSPGQNGAPVVDDAAAVAECDIDAVHPAGDHLIVVGRVTRVASDSSRPLLVYTRSAYRQLD